MLQMSSDVIMSAILDFTIFSEVGWKKNWERKQEIVTFDHRPRFTLWELPLTQRYYSVEIKGNSDKKYVHIYKIVGASECLVRYKVYHVVLEKSRNKELNVQLSDRQQWRGNNFKKSKRTQKTVSSIYISSGTFINFFTLLLLCEIKLLKLSRMANLYLLSSLDPPSLPAKSWK